MPSGEIVGHITKFSLHPHRTITLVTWWYASIDVEFDPDDLEEIVSVFLTNEVRILVNHYDTDELGKPRFKLQRIEVEK